MGGKLHRGKLLTVCLMVSEQRTAFCELNVEWYYAQTGWWGESSLQFGLTCQLDQAALLPPLGN